MIKKYINECQAGLLEQPNKHELISDFVKYRRNLPHWQIPGSVYFITFRTQDIILNDKSKDIIYDSILFHNNVKYKIYSFVIMPDHVHIIIQPLEAIKDKYFSLVEINHSLKSFSANKINELEDIKHRNVWQHESFDRIIRNDEELNEKMVYVLNNPIKKGLIDSGDNYKWYYLEDLNCNRNNP